VPEQFSSDVTVSMTTICHHQHHAVSLIHLISVALKFETFLMYIRLLHTVDKPQFNIPRTKLLKTIKNTRVESPG